MIRRATSDGCSFPCGVPVCGGEMPARRAARSAPAAAIPCRSRASATRLDNPLWERLLGAGSRRTGFGLPLLRPRQRVARADPPLQIRRRMASCTRYGRMVRSLPGRQRPLRHGGGGSSPCRCTGANGCAADTISRSTSPRGSPRAPRRSRSPQRPPHAQHRRAGPPPPRASGPDNVEGVFSCAVPNGSPGSTPAGRRRDDHGRHASLVRLGDPARCARLPHQHRGPGRFAARTGREGVMYNAVFTIHNSGFYGRSRCVKVCKLGL